MARAARGIHQVHISTEWKDVPVLMDAAAVARVLGRNHEAVRRAIQQGRLPGIKVGGGWLVRKDALMAHLGYAQWEIERYGYGMNTAPGAGGYGPMVKDEFKDALQRKEGNDQSPSHGEAVTAPFTHGGHAANVAMEGVVA